MSFDKLSYNKDDAPILPKGWEIKTIGDVCKVIAGQSPEGKFYNDNGNGLPFYQGKKEYGEKYIGEPTTWTTKVTKEAEANDILMSVRAPVGPINFATQKICIGRGLAAIRATKLIDKEFLFNFLLKHESEIVGNAGAVFNSINKAQIEAIPIPLPPLPEQQRIVSILDEAFALISRASINAERCLRLSKALFESYLQGVFENGNCDVKKLGDLSERVSVGHVGETSKFYCEPTIGVPFLRSQNVRSGYLDLQGLQYITPEFHESLKKSQLRKGDLLFVRVGANRGDCCVVKEDFEKLNCANIVFARIKQGNVDFIDRYCQSVVGRKQLLGMSVGAAQGVINTKSVAELEIPFPSLKEQQTIVRQLDTLRAETQKLEAVYQKKMADLEELKKSILDKAFKGELNVSELGFDGLKDDRIIKEDKVKTLQSSNAHSDKKNHLILKSYKS